MLTTVNTSTMAVGGIAVPDEKDDHRPQHHVAQAGQQHLGAMWIGTAMLQ